MKIQRQLLRRQISILKSISYRIKPSETQATNVFNTALQFWIEIDLPTLQKKLDNQGIELKDEQKQ